MAKLGVQDAETLIPVREAQHGKASVCVSIVSHGHGAMVERLVNTLLGFSEVGKLILTLNVPESLIIPDDSRIKWLENATTKGFGANHNAAFQMCREEFFCVLNPDIEFLGNPFPILLEALKLERAAVAAPLVVSPAGLIEDSIRYFPRPIALLMKFLFKADGRYSAKSGQEIFFPEWCAGMFLLFRSQDFERLGGFDEHYFLYYEDVDICVRVWQQRMRVVACPKVSVVHDARRDSRRSLKHLRWHLASMMRFFWRHLGRLPSVPGSREFE
jgi:N-acetylglucosaminyl-diphospho-decaprenol L-rhamnosyltransferase